MTLIQTTSLTADQRLFVDLIATMSRDQVGEVLVALDVTLRDSDGTATEFWSADFLHEVQRAAEKRLAAIALETP